MKQSEELRKLYLVLEKLNDFFHQPDNYSEVEKVQQFAKDIYPELHEMYYGVVWQMLPDDLKEELSDRE